MSNRQKIWLHFGIIALLLVLLNAFLNNTFFRIDLTKEKRFTLSESGISTVERLEEPVDVFIFLQNKNLPSGFKRLQRATRDLLTDLNVHAKGKIYFEFEDPLDGLSGEERLQQLTDLRKRGIIPTNARIKTKDGIIEKLIFPAALINYKDRQIPVQLLAGDRGQEDLNRSIELLEYQIVSALNKVQNDEPPKVAFLEGHGELSREATFDLEERLYQNFYQVGRFNPDELDSIPKDLDLIIVARPTKPFSEIDKFKIDQYVMNGGKMMWLIDPMKMNLDSLRYQWGGTNVAVDFDLNLDDILFKYGVRLNRNLVRDLQNKPIPVVVDERGQTRLLPWAFYPLISPSSDHIIGQNTDPLSLEFASSLDMLNVKGIEPTVVLSTSDKGGVVANPVLVSLEELRRPPDAANFARQNIPIGVLLEGEFPSVYKNRASPLENWQNPRKDVSSPTKMLVIADGDIAKNEVLPDGQTLPLGFDRSLRQQFGNKAFLMNAVEYLTFENNVLEARNKQVELRLLNRNKAEQERTKWQFLNIGLPVIFILFFGFIYNYLRRRKYTR